MMIVLDTSCISVFMRAGQLDLLIATLNGNEIVITEQVYHELRLSKINALKTFSSDKISIRPSKSSITDVYPIHIGEASVIMFTKSNENNALAVIDDKKAREAAKSEGIKFIGTVALIKLVLEKGVLKKAKVSEILYALTSKGGLYISDELKGWLEH